VRALVTGATDGIGRHIAEELVRAGAEVVITGRDPDRGAAAARAMGAAFISVDHSVLAENARFIERLHWSTLDILVNNVGGGVRAERTTTPEGHELGLALNYLGPVTLTDALLPRLAEDAHLVNVCSSAYAMVRDDPFIEPERYVGIIAHARAKQLLLLATLSLARQRPRLRVNAVNPGMAWTPGTRSLTREAVPAWRYVWPMVRLLQRRADPVRAAAAPTRWALRPTATGCFIESDGRPRRLPQRLVDPQRQDRAWAEALGAYRMGGGAASENVQHDP
jgi:NAD(P)-dependent dehydrogenase (short-subunit alcohol dehydrogenase family)